MNSVKNQSFLNLPHQPARAEAHHQPEDGLHHHQRGDDVEPMEDEDPTSDHEQVEDPHARIDPALVAMGSV